METVRFTNYEELTGHGRTALRADALAIAAAGLRAADPAEALASALRVEGDRLLVRGAPIMGLDRRGDESGEGDETVTAVELAGRRLFLLGAGKATLGMAEVLDGLLGPRFADAAIVVKRGQAHPHALRYVEVLEAAHPVPDETSLSGGLRLQAIAAAARPGDLVIGLVTGGSSALAVVPAEGISLADKIETNRLLLASGADPREETPKELASVRTWVMADAARMCAAAVAEAQARGYAAELLGLDWQGEARDAGSALARRLAGSASRSCLVAGGENTVTLTGGAGRSDGRVDQDAALAAARRPGRGGPNQEAALAAAIELAGGPAAVVACLDSDGSDGPTDAAGGLVDDTTAAALAAAGGDGAAALAGHDAYDTLTRAGDLMFTGPTDTNFNDLKIALRGA
jgi:glycerate 2-kinase